MNTKVNATFLAILYLQYNIVIFKLYYNVIYKNIYLNSKINNIIYIKNKYILIYLVYFNFI